MKTMKTLRLSSICLLLVAVNSSDAVASLTVTSETHHVWGEIGLGGTTVGSYDYTDNHPVSSATYYDDWDFYAYSSTGLLEVQVSSAHLPPSGDLGYWGVAHADADATWTFQPDEWSLLRLEEAVETFQEAGIENIGVE